MLDVTLVIMGTGALLLFTGLFRSGGAIGRPESLGKTHGLEEIARIYRMSGFVLIWFGAGLFVLGGIGVLFSLVRRAVF